MKKMILGLWVAAFLPLQGCFWHSTEVRDREVPAGGASTTSVVAPPSGSTVTTTTNP